MLPIRLTAVYCLLLAIEIAPAQDEAEPKVRGKGTTEWVAILRTAKEPNQRRAAIVALSILGPKQLEVVPSLATAVSDADEQVRVAAIQTLGGMGQDSRGAVDALGRAATDDKAPTVRSAACQALGKLGPIAQAAAPKLLEALSDPDPRTRAGAAVALPEVKIDSAVALTPLTKTLDDSDRLVRVAAASALGRLDSAGKSALKLGKCVQSDSDAEVRRACAQALLQLGANVRPAYPALLEAIAKEKLPDVRQRILAILAVVDSEAKHTGPIFVLAAKDSDARCRVMAIRGLGRQNARFDGAVPALIEALKDDVIDVRLAATQELAESGAPPAKILPALKATAKGDARSVVRDAAAQAVKKLEPRMP
jgi:HEAT repeat protein